MTIFGIKQPIMHGLSKYLSIAALLLAFGILSSFYYKYVFDEIIYSKAVFSLHRLGYGSRFAPLIPKNAKSNDMKNIKKWKSQRTLLINFTIFYLLIKLIMEILKP